MRYEVRYYALEELLPENRMTYLPCYDQQTAKEEYAKALDEYADNMHVVRLCRVTYGPDYERVETLASSEYENPRHIIWEDEYV